METSRGLSRCLQQLSVHNQSCLRPHSSSSSTATRRLRSQRNLLRHTFKHTHTSRSLHTSRTSQQEDPSQLKQQETPQQLPQQDAQSASSRSEPQPQAATPSQDQQLPSPQRAIPRRNASSLSRLLDEDPTSTPRERSSPPASSPKPFSRSIWREETHSKLDSLVADMRKPKVAQTAKPPTSRPTSNYDTYGESSSLFRSTRTPTRPGPAGTGLALNVRDMIPSYIDPVDQALYEKNREMERAREQLRLHPSLGKTVDVNDASGFTVTRALITLDARINKNGNSVRADERDQKFHVRRGQKRKLEKRRRWRVVFRAGFVGEVGRVRKMIRQGW